MTTINPADCLPHEVYEGTVHGVERTVLIRRDASDSYPWESLGEVLDHEDVSGLVRLVPAREVTRQDLPRIAGADVAHDSIVEGVLDAVVAHLNANGGLPTSSDGVYGIPREDYAYVDWPATCAAANERADRAEADRDRWRRAHGLVEQERDQAREALADIRSTLKATNDAMVEAAERERDEADDRLTAKLVAARRERDEAVARAEKAEWPRGVIAPGDTVVYLGNPYGSSPCPRGAVFTVDAVHEGAGRVSFEWPGVEGACVDLSRVRKVETAAPVPAPAVTREDVEKAIRTAYNKRGYGYTSGDIDVSADAVCALFGVEAEQPDPVLDKAQEFAALADWELTDREAKFLHMVAAHVVGQETNQ